MTPEDKVERFKKVAGLMRDEGRSDQEIERAFRNYLDCERRNAKAEARAKARGASGLEQKRIMSIKQIMKKVTG